MDDELLAASSRLAAAEQRRRQLARSAAQEAAELVRKRKALEASRREQEERSARAAAARVALEVSKFWRSCLRAAQHFEVQQRQAAKTRQHFENIQALVSKGEALSHEVNSKLFEDGSSSDSLGEPPEKALKELKPFETGPARQRLKQELETQTDGDFDRRHLSQQVTTQVPVLLLKHPIREYQHVGLHWLATLHDKQFNGILADEMGLGKTIMTIALLAHLALVKEIWGPHLVVVPSSVLLNWVKELKKWTPGLKVCAYFGDAEERRQKRKGWTAEDAFHVCVVSYSVALQDLHALKRRRWYYMILDEAQHIKNFRSRKWQQLMRFNTEHRLLLTGTPLQNNLTELWSLMHFLMPEMFQSYSDFKEFFSDPLQQALQEKRVDQEQDLVARLHKVIRPFMLRRLKSEVERQLPNKHEYVVRCPLSRRQQVLYEEFMQRRETQRVLKRGDYISMMGILMQLRKVCNHPELFEPRGAVTPFVMAALDFHVPACLFNIAPQPGEENFCSLLLPLLSLWRLEVSMKASQQPPIAEVVDYIMPAKRRRTSLPSPGPLRSGAERRGLISAANQKWMEEWYLAQLRVEEERREARADVAAAVDYLLYLASIGRPWIGVDGMARLRLSGSRGRRPFLWPEPARPRAQRSALEEPCALSAMWHALPRALERHWRSYVALWSFRVEPVQVQEQHALCVAPAPTSLVRLRPHGGLAAWRRGEALAVQLQRRLSEEVRAGGLKCHLPEKHYLESDCGKLRALASLLHDFRSRGDKCIIFTQFIKMLDVLEDFVCYHSFTYVRLDGSVKVERRQDLVDRFNEDDRLFLFICSTRAGGVGINLTSANVVIFYDSDWNPAMDRQATDRAHRIGQTREVRIYRLISEHTIEENIWQRQLQKRELDDVVVDQGRFNVEKLKSLHQGAPEKAWSLADVRSMLAALPEPQAEVSTEASTEPKSLAEFEQLLSLVEDTQDSYKVERSLAEQVEVEFQSKPLVKPPQMESWLSLPRLVRWGVHRVRLLGVEEALAKRPRPRTKRKRVPLAS